MAYAQGRTFYDADSHLMELPDWLVEFADPGIRDRLRPLALGGAGALADAALRGAELRRTDETASAALEGNVMGPKGWGALGAFDPVERSRALDLLGFDAQLVFSTFAATQFASDDLDLLYGGTRAHNRGMAEFCSADRRLIPVGYAPLADATRALDAAREAIALGCGAILVPSAPPKDKSPTHPDYWPLWEHLEETGVPFMLHIGGGGRPLRRAFHVNGKPPVTDFLGGGENIRAKDFVAMHHPPETFLACMVLDGVFDQFPGLRGGCIEQGALWVVPLLQRLDIAQDTFKRTEPALNLPLRASDYLRRQVKFTPFPTEPVGWMIEQAGTELFMFSSDYPHPEGGHDPLGRFAASLESTDDDARERFFARNFADMIGPALTRA